jgi:disulfide bond formation protein DsbB
MEYFTTLNTIVGYATLGMQIAAVALLIAYLKKQREIDTIVAAWAIPAALALTILATLMSLVYSEYFGIVPCGLCWLQRGFMYPQVVLFAVAYAFGDARVFRYSIALSVIGAALGLYQHYLQMGGASVLPCPASGATDCAQRIIFEMGYITFPLVGFSVFALLIVLMLFLGRVYYSSEHSAH